MEELIILGTGYAMALDCYNTCFLLKNSKEEMILVDTGGGNQILKRLKEAKVEMNQIHHIILSHKHTDHVLGIFWIIRRMQKILANGTYEGNLTIYMHRELESEVRQICNLLLPQKFLRWIDDRILFQVVEDQEIVPMNSYSIQFFDLQSKKDKQFGFRTTLENGETLVFFGDEMFREELRKEVEGANWLLHETFCLECDAEEMKPYEKMHSTAKVASQKAESLGVKNLILYHTEDKRLKDRKRLYTEEGSQYFSGNLYVPDDLERIVLSKKKNDCEI